jgi:hypothetical protein
VKWPSQRDRFCLRLNWEAACWLSSIKPPRALSAADFDPPVDMWSTRKRCPYVHGLTSSIQHPRSSIETFRPAWISTQVRRW